MSRLIKASVLRLDRANAALRRTLLTALVAGLPSAVPAQPAPQVRALANPPVVLQATPGPGPQLVAPQRAAPDAAAARGGQERFYDLAIRYKRSSIFDPTTGRDQPVDLRSYVDRTAPTEGRFLFVAPQIEATPGDTIRMTLRNQLPADPSCTDPSIPVDHPHCFNGTNMHTHGLWVSPAGNSDNVLLSINPTVDFQYEYNIPIDHPAGTFWYHPHRHGSTAIQVGSGMAGALIIRGDRPPTPKANGDLDVLLGQSSPEPGPVPDRTLLFLQIPYYCPGENAQPVTNSKGDIVWTCSPGQVGVVESESVFFPTSDGGSNWQASGRWTSINGVVLPTIADAQAGQPERFRLIHAGARETINFGFRKMRPGAAPIVPGTPTRGTIGTVVKDECPGELVPYQVVAADGLTMDRTLTRDAVTLQPGYRYDLLVVFPEPGNYCMVQPPEPSAGSVGKQPASNADTLLGYVTAGGSPGTSIPQATQTLVEALVKLAEKNIPVDVRDQVIADLRRVEGPDNRPAPRLTRFVAHPTVTDDEVRAMPEQHLVFIRPRGNATPGFGVANSFEVENQTEDKGTQTLVPKTWQPYAPDRIDRPVILGMAQQWELRSYSDSHPFHIHVNPFQIVAVYNDQGVDISKPGAVDGDGDRQYEGLQGVWKDTLWVKSNIPYVGTPQQLTNPPTGYYRLIVRTRYERYIGEYVLHCHILDHEDLGMMQNVSIGLPGLTPAAPGRPGGGHGHR